MSHNTHLNRRKFIQLAGLSGAGLVLSSYASTTSSSKILRFGLITDSHYAEKDPWLNRYYREAPDKMQACIDVMNAEQVDFVMHLGDFKDQGENKNEKETLGYLAKMESIYTSFKGNTYHCVGNHDVDSIKKTQFLENITNSGIPKDKSYYSFDIENFHCVVLDANFHADGKDHFYLDGVDWQDPNIPEHELNWLNDDLNNTALPTLVFCHHPLYPFHRENFLYHVKNYDKAEAILTNSKKVIAIFQGHVHEEQYVNRNGMQYITQLGMVDFSGHKNNSFSIVEIDNQSINILGYNRAGNMKFN